MKFKMPGNKLPIQHFLLSQEMGNKDDMWIRPKKGFGNTISLVFARFRCMLFTLADFKNNIKFLKQTNINIFWEHKIGVISISEDCVD